MINDDSQVLVIDDIRTFEGVTHARTAAEGIRLLESQEWDEVWLDHDLGGCGTIRPVVEWLDKNVIAADLIIISFNPVGVKYIGDTLSPKYRMAKYPGGVGLGREILVKA